VSGYCDRHTRRWRVVEFFQFTVFAFGLLLLLAVVAVALVGAILFGVVFTLVGEWRSGEAWRPARHLLALAPQYQRKEQARRAHTSS
jgi:hypothetical protein